MIRVPSLGFGSARLRGAASPFGAEVTPAVAESLLRQAVDSGIEVIDTSPCYGDVESLIGDVLHERRGDLTIATKCGCPAEPGQREHAYSVGNIRAGIERSLRRLRTDRLDIVQLHMPPDADQLAASGTLEELERWRGRGVIGALGVSEVLPALEAHLALGVFDVVQVPYSALDRRHEQVITEMAASGLRVIARGVLARGAPADVRTAVDPLPPPYAREIRRQHGVWERSGLEQMLPEMPPMELMLRFALSNPDISTVLIGTADPGHLAAHVEAAGRGPLPEPIHRRAVQLLDGAADHDPHVDDPSAI